jgi:predicted MFS family arabinose efflux permease
LTDSSTAAAQPFTTSPAVPDEHLLSKKTAALVFLSFAAAYFCSALVRAITATLAPELSREFSLQAGDLGLLGAGYFLGFAAMQLPLGSWLDQYGPKRVMLCFLSVGVIGCAAFALAGSFSGLLVARILIGMGVSACLMAALTGFRRWLDAASLVRANAWMLMSGSLGMLASTLPVQALMPLTGWRALFWILAAMILVAMAVIAVIVPPWPQAAQASNTPAASYSTVWKNRYFQRLAPLAFFNYGGLVAVQTLWAGPWMVKVAGYSPLQAATGLFYINAAMLVTFWLWGLLSPRLALRGLTANKLITRGAPLSLLALAGCIAGGESTGWLGWALFCMTSSVISLSQPAIGMAFPASLVGRALSAFNLVIFSGVFVVQWGIGLLIDAFAAAGLARTPSFQAAMGVFLCCAIASYLYFLVAKADNSRS